jgi:zinc-ribbon domain
MFCPQCGSEWSDGQHYCRACGTNLKVIGKVVSFSDAISKSDSVPAKVKDEISRAMQKVNQEIARGSAEHRHKLPWRKEKTAEERRERHLTKGAIKFFSGGGLSIFLYFLFHAVELRVPPDVVARVPFAIDPVVRILWTIGLIPMLSGVGHILAGLSIRPRPTPEIAPAIHSPLQIDAKGSDTARIDSELTMIRPRDTAASVTEHTTDILHRDESWQNSPG